MDDLDSDALSFTYVQHGKKNKKSRPGKKRPVPPSFNELLSGTSDTLGEADWIDKLVRTFFFKACQHGHLTPAIECLEEFLSKHHKSFRPLKGLCLGLGSPLESVNARAQLSVLIRICEYFGLVSLEG